MTSEVPYTSMQEASIYPKDALDGNDRADAISPYTAPTLDALFRERVRRTPNKTAYTEFDFDSGEWCDYSWRDVALEVERWRRALKGEGLAKGDSVALRLRNCRHWVIFDQAALSLGLVVVPLYVADRPDNVNYVLQHSDSKLLLVEHEDAWRELQQAEGEFPQLRRVVVLGSVSDQDDLVVSSDRWIESGRDCESSGTEPGDLASIVYTSGTTGRPKGVMLSHRNMLLNAYGGLRSVAVLPTDVLLSFLPLSHTLERTVGYYVPMMAGARVVYNRSIPQLSEDLVFIRPTGVISVPRIFERVYTALHAEIENGAAWKRRLFRLAVDIGWQRFEYLQGRRSWRWSFVYWPLLDAIVAHRVRARLGGRVRIAVVGGAPLPPAVSRLFVALGVNILQGYGLTESSPCISINTLERNRPATVGLPLRDVEVIIGKDDELLTRGPHVMMGYWKDPSATAQVLEGDGWLHTGDQAVIDDEGFISITGRIKDIVVLANGEKISPTDMESAIAEDALFEQAMVVGEQMPYLTALVVLNKEMWLEAAAKLKIDNNDKSISGDERVESWVLERIRRQIRGFPGYARIRRATAMLMPWTVDNGLLTPTLKLKRAEILERYQEDIRKMYEGHETFKEQ